MVASRGRLAVIRDVAGYDLDDLQEYFADVDLVLTEGFKRADRPKIEIVRTERSPEPLCAGRPELFALVTDAALNAAVPRFSLEDVPGVADLIEERFLK
jgi:molybdopterin-guanine dinucleotide biosynthesis protein B